MVMIGRFSSDDPGWCDPWDREPERSQDDGDWVGLDPRPKRKRVQGQRCTGAEDQRSKGAEGKESEAEPEGPRSDSPTFDF
jgi:hypothetical protein